MNSLFSLSENNRVLLPGMFDAVLFGAGGHAQVLIDCLKCRQPSIALALLDPRSNLWKTSLLDVPILGSDELLPELIRQGIRSFAVAVGSVGDCRRRQQLYKTAIAHALEPLTIVHPSAVCSRWANLGAGTQILPAAVLNAGASTGINVIINSGAIVEHDCIVGDHAHVATGARLAGGVRVGAGAHIGVGATVKENIRIGDRAIVGAGAVVVRAVPARTVVAGVPARKLRIIDPTPSPVDRVPS
jgi:sugar O-acyltransferase (sialic acid O-acetyltransferase NeuD family)